MTKYKLIKDLYLIISIYNGLEKRKNSILKSRIFLTRMGGISFTEKEIMKLIDQLEIESLESRLFAGYPKKHSRALHIALSEFRGKKREQIERVQKRFSKYKDVQYYFDTFISEIKKALEEEKTNISRGATWQS